MSNASIYISHGLKHPYHGKPPKDWAEVAALGVLADLCDRRGIKQELRPIRGDEDLSIEIVESLAEIIRTAQKDLNLHLLSALKILRNDAAGQSDE